MTGYVMYLQNRADQHKIFHATDNQCLDRTRIVLRSSHASVQNRCQVNAACAVESYAKEMTASIYDS